MWFYVNLPSIHQCTLHYMYVQCTTFSLHTVIYVDKPEISHFLLSNTNTSWFSQSSYHKSTRIVRFEAFSTPVRTWNDYRFWPDVHIHMWDESNGKMCAKIYLNTYVILAHISNFTLKHACVFPKLSFWFSTCDVDGNVSCEYLGCITSWA